MRLLIVLLLVLPGTQALTLERMFVPEPPAEAFDAYGVAVTDLFGTGPTAVLQNDDSRTYWFTWDGTWGRVETRHPNGTSWHTQTLNGVSIADMDDDGALDVAILNTGGYLSRLEAEDGRLVERWNRSIYPPDLDAGYWGNHSWEPVQPATAATHVAHGHAVIGTPRQGEAPWVWAISDDLPGAYAFDADGTLQWRQAWFDAHAGPWLGELRRYEEPTLMVATDAGSILALEAFGGGLRWRFDVPEDVQPGSISVAPVVFDVDGDHRNEVFFGARVAIDTREDGWMQRQHARYYLLDSDGSEIWNMSHPAGNPMVHSEALPYDVDGDGRLDLVVMDWNTIGRKPGNFEYLGPGKLFAIDGRDGRVRWSQDVDAPFTDFPLAAADLGVPAVLVPHRNGTPGIAAFSMLDGQELAWTSLPDGWNATRGVVLVEAPAGTQAWVPVHRNATTCIPKQDIGCRQGAIAVYALEGTIIHPGHDTRSYLWAPAPAPSPSTGPGDADPEVVPDNEAAAPAPWLLALGIMLARRLRH